MKNIFWQQNPKALSSRFCFQNKQKNSDTPISKQKEMDAALEKKLFLQGLFHKETREKIKEWRNENREAVIHWTQDEEKELKEHIRSLRKTTPALSKERVQKKLELLDYIRNGEKQESFNHTQQKKLNSENSRTDFVKNIEKSGIEKFANVEKKYMGNSDYFVVLIPQFHEGRNADVKEIYKIQKEIFEIQKILIDKGLCNVFGYEGFVSKEFAKEIPSLSRFKATENEKPSDFFEDLLEKNYGRSVFSFGIEDGETSDNSDGPGERLWAFDDFTKLVKRSKLIPCQKETYLGFFNQKEFVEKVGTKNAENLKKKVVKIIKNKELIQESDQELILNTLRQEFSAIAISKRNQAIIKNIENRENSLGSNAIGIKIGLAHISGLQSILEKRGISYVTIKPKSVKQEESEFIKK